MGKHEHHYVYLVDGKWEYSHRGQNKDLGLPKVKWDEGKPNITRDMAIERLKELLNASKP